MRWLSVMASGCLAWLLLGSVLADPVDFVLPDLDGREHRLADYRGKWVLVNYWATWCPPCLDELPELEVFYSNHKDKDAVVIGVNMETIGTEELREFLDEQFISYPILRTPPRRSTELGPIPGMPTSYLISPAGELVARRVGPVTAKAMEAFIEDFEQKHTGGN